MHADISSIPPGAVLRNFPRLAEVAHRCCFGTDWPGPGVKRVQANTEALRELPLPSAAKRDLFWNAANRLFGYDHESVITP